VLLFHRARINHTAQLRFSSDIEFRSYSSYLRGGNFAPQKWTIAMGHEFPENAEGRRDLGGSDRYESGQLHRGTITGWHVLVVRHRGFFCILGFRRRRTPYRGSAFRGMRQREKEAASRRKERGRLLFELNPTRFETGTATLRVVHVGEKSRIRIRVQSNSLSLRIEHQAREITICRICDA